MHFGENQLSLSLIGLSPLSTGHPKAFQRLPVRSSSGFYPAFNLPMDRSLSFGSAATGRAGWRRKYNGAKGLHRSRRLQLDWSGRRAFLSALKVYR